jgi:hypothetical protein
MPAFNSISARKKFRLSNSSARRRAVLHQPVMEALEDRQLMSVVTNTNDSGPGSLRQAILDCNASHQFEIIKFDIPGTFVHTISPLTPLPVITNSIAIDGYSQPGASGNTLSSGDDANILIQLRGTDIKTASDGLNLAAGGTVMGLAISGFQGAQIHITSGTGSIRGNFIGTTPAGTAQAQPSTGTGVELDNCKQCLLGGTDAAGRNIISGNGIGVRVLNSTPVFVEGNYIGTDATGKVGIGNTRAGVFLDNSPSAVIGGNGNGGRNVISASSGGAGVIISGDKSKGNLVQNNYIGIDVTGMKALANGTGVLVTLGASSNTIGGNPGLGNIISGNTADGVQIIGGAFNHVAGNIIGLSADITKALANQGCGVEIDNSRGNTVDDTNGPGQGNLSQLIECNGKDGVRIVGPAGVNIVAGNAIRSNRGDGIFIQNSPMNTIGGASAVRSNNITLNGKAGVEISGAGAKSNVIVGNTIGSEFKGNTGPGVLISNAPDNFVGATPAADANVIAGNQIGVSITGAVSKGNLVQGNFIGVDARLQLGGLWANLGHGVFIGDGASSNTIGGQVPGAPNFIYYNHGAGVFVDSGVSNLISRNSIFGNTALGIDLAPAGVTPNDNLDPDVGPNMLQNYPDLKSATADNDIVSSTGPTVIKGQLNSTPNTTFTLEFFSNVRPDPSGHGQGQTYIGSLTVVTDAGGKADFTFTATQHVHPGYYIAATATDPSKNTSEFSGAIRVTANPRLGLNNAGSTLENSKATFALSATDPSGIAGPLTFKITDPTIHGTLGSFSAPIGATGPTGTRWTTQVQYTPASGFTGTDFFVYSVTNAFGDSVMGSFMISVNPKVTDVPVVHTHSYTLAENHPLLLGALGGVLSGDTDPAGHSLAAKLFSGPSSGEFQLSSDGSFTYVPNNGFTGTDSVVCTVFNAFGGSVQETIEFVVKA